MSCAERERINPLDPKNPETLGKPTGLSVISNQDTVNLSWNSIDLEGLDGFRIYRKEEPAGGFLLHSFVPPDSVTFQDTDVEFDVEYSYTLTAVGETFESPRSDTLTIRPGPTVNWIGHRGGLQLLKLTHDARHVVRGTSGFFPIVDIEVDPQSGQVWVVERLSETFGSVVRVSALGKPFETVIQFSSPRDAAIDENAGALWVADDRQGVVIKLSKAGEQLVSVSRFQEPFAVSVDQRDGSCWVVDRSTNSISKITASGQPLQTVTTVAGNAIHGLSVHSTDGSIWVAAGSQVMRFDDHGNMLHILDQEFVRATAVAVDAVTGDAWIADEGRSQVSMFTAAGTLAFVLDLFDLPSDLAINLFDHSCLVADAGSDRVLMISRGGQPTAIFEAVTEPQAVGVWNRPRAK